MALHQLELCKKFIFNSVIFGRLFRAPHWLVLLHAVPLPNLFQDLFFSPCVECRQLQGQYCPLKSRPGVTVSKWVISVGHEKESEREKQWGRVCVQLLVGVPSTELI